MIEEVSQGAGSALGLISGLLVVFSVVREVAPLA